MESGLKLNISVIDGWTRLECWPFGAYNKVWNVQEIAELFREREEYYRSSILSDKIYRTQKYIDYCGEGGIWLSDSVLGRYKKGETRGKAQNCRGAYARVEVAWEFGLAKRK